MRASLFLIAAALAGSAAAHDAAHCTAALTGGWAYTETGAGAPMYVLTLKGDGTGEVTYGDGDAIPVTAWKAEAGKSAETCALTMTAADSTETNEVTLKADSFTMNGQGSFQKL